MEHAPIIVSVVRNCMPCTVYKTASSTALASQKVRSNNRFPTYLLLTYVFLVTGSVSKKMMPFPYSS